MMSIIEHGRAKDGRSKDGVRVRLSTRTLLMTVYKMSHRCYGDEVWWRLPNRKFVSNIVIGVTCIEHTARESNGANKRVRGVVVACDIGECLRQAQCLVGFCHCYQNVKFALDYLPFHQTHRIKITRLAGFWSERDAKILLKYTCDKLYNRVKTQTVMRPSTVV